MCYNQGLATRTLITKRVLSRVLATRGFQLSVVVTPGRWCGGCIFLVFTRILAEFKKELSSNVVVLN